MDSQEVKETEEFDWGFLLEISLISNVTLLSMRDMTLKAIFFLQGRSQELFEVKMQMGAAGSMLG